MLDRAQLITEDSKNKNMLLVKGVSVIIVSKITVAEHNEFSHKKGNI